MYTTLQQQILVDWINAAMAEQNAWMATEREKRRQRRDRPAQGWQDVAITIAKSRNRRQAAQQAR